jgi:hypothetical protein
MNLFSRLFGKKITAVMIIDETLRQICKVTNKDHRPEDISKCSKIFEDLDNRLVSGSFDTSQTARLAEEVIPLLLDILMTDIPLQESALRTLSNTIAVSSEKSISWDEDRVQSVLMNRLARLNDEVDKNPDIYCLINDNPAIIITMIMKRLCRPMPETLDQLQRLKNWPFAECANVRSAAEAALEKLSQT